MSNPTLDSKNRQSSGALFASGCTLLFFTSAAIVTPHLFASFVLRFALGPILFFLSGTLIVAALSRLRPARASTIVWGCLSLFAAGVLFGMRTYQTSPEDGLGQTFAVITFVVVLAPVFTVQVIVWLALFARRTPIWRPLAISALGATGAYCTALTLAEQSWATTAGFDVLFPVLAWGTLVGVVATWISAEDRFRWSHSA